MHQLYGNTTGLSPHAVKALERIYRRKVPLEHIATPELIKSLAEASHETGRQVGALVHRSGVVDYVVVGETRNYSFEAITKAIRAIANGARFIATNPDATGPSAEGLLPATGAITALITKATGKEPYVVGKPNPRMFRSALNRIGAHSESTGMIGDRMDTDIVAGIEAGLHTVLVLTGISDPAEVERFPFRPDEILESIAELLPAGPEETEFPEGL